MSAPDEVKRPMAPPKKGPKPKTIKQKMEESPEGYNPGGPHTPGAKKKRKAKRRADPLFPVRGHARERKCPINSRMPAMIGMIV